MSVNQKFLTVAGIAISLIIIHRFSPKDAWALLILLVGLAYCACQSGRRD